MLSSWQWNNRTNQVRSLHDSQEVDPILARLRYVNRNTNSNYDKKTRRYHHGTHKPCARLRARDFTASLTKLIAHSVNRGHLECLRWSRKKFVLNGSLLFLSCNCLQMIILGIFLSCWHNVKAESCGHSGRIPRSHLEGMAANESEKEGSGWHQHAILTALTP